MIVTIIINLLRKKIKNTYQIGTPCYSLFFIRPRLSLVRAKGKDPNLISIYCVAGYLSVAISLKKG